LTPPSNVAGLVAQLDRLITDPALARRLGEAARRQVQQHYDLRTNAAKLAGIFTERVTDSPRINRAG
jgi:glycosyltransferase involved in cell wall biosynthesis